MACMPSEDKNASPTELRQTSGRFNFIRKKHARIELLFPFLVTSIPMSYLGGTIKLPKDIFYWIVNNLSNAGCELILVTREPYLYGVTVKIRNYSTPYRCMRDMPVQDGGDMIHHTSDTVQSAQGLDP